MATTNGNLPLLRKLRDQVEHRYQADLAALDRLAQLLEDTTDVVLAGLISKAQQPTRAPGAESSKSIGDRIEDVLGGARIRGRWMNARAIAESLRLDPRAVRTALYTDTRDRFEQKKLSPRRVVWRLKEPAKVL